MDGEAEGRGDGWGVRQGDSTGREVWTEKVHGRDYLYVSTVPEPLLGSTAEAAVVAISSCEVSPLENTAGACEGWGELGSVGVGALLLAAVTLQVESFLDAGGGVERSWVSAAIRLDGSLRWPATILTAIYLGHQSLSTFAEVGRRNLIGCVVEVVAPRVGVEYSSGDAVKLFRIWFGGCCGSFTLI